MDTPTMSGNAGVLEIAWTAFAVLALLFSLGMAVLGLRDLLGVEEAIRRHPPLARRWGPRWWVAVSAVVSNTVLCWPWLVFLAVGVIAMRYPPPPPSVEQQVSSVLVGWLFLSAEIALVFVQGWHLYVRYRVSEETGAYTKPDLHSSEKGGVS